jgi:hypothetical protein
VGGGEKGWVSSFLFRMTQSLLYFSVPPSFTGKGVRG